MQTMTTPVLIVGGGAAGLTLANDLGWRDVSCLVVEQGDGVITTPKTGHISARTMEHCRRWGFVDEVSDCGFPRDYPLDTVLCTSLTGYEIHREITPSIEDTKPLPFSPVNRTRCPQMWFEPLLSRKATERETVSIRYWTRLDSIDESGDTIVANLTDLTTDEPLVVECDYLVGCDGANSIVREHLGIEMEGNPLLAYSLIILFDCPELLEYHDKGPAERYSLIGPEGWRGNITVVDGKRLWRLGVGGQMERFDFDTLDIDALVHRALGRDDVEFEVKLYTPWKRTQLVANRFSRGKVFIVGDAVHTMSPTGGFGMNTAVDDSVNLGWKLEAAVKGWAGPKLLQSYEAERKPIAVRNSAAAADNFARWKENTNPAYIEEDSERGRRSREEMAKAYETVARRVQRSEGVILGLRYENSPICVPDGTPEPPDEYEQHIPVARPGHRAPHVSLDDGSSTLDLFGNGFVGMHNERGRPAAGALEKSAADLGVPISLQPYPSTDVESAYERDVVLVRPDGHVAYGGTPTIDSDDATRRILETVTGRR